MQEFLFYYEKSPPGHLRDKENPLLEERIRKNWDPLVKQTYSVWVDGPRGRQKWHLSKHSQSHRSCGLCTVTYSRYRRIPSPQLHISRRRLWIVCRR